MNIYIKLIFLVVIVFSSIRVSYSDGHSKKISPAIINLLFEGMLSVIDNGGKIIVTVKDSLTNEPLQGIKVALDLHDKDRYTDINGVVNYTKLLPGDYGIYIYNFYSDKYSYYESPIITLKENEVKSLEVLLDMRVSYDGDNDKIPDAWELEHGLDKDRDDALEDKDKDGSTNLREYREDTDPEDASSLVDFNEETKIIQQDGKYILKIAIDFALFPSYSENSIISIVFFRGGLASPKSASFDIKLDSSIYYYDIDITSIVSTINFSYPYEINLSSKNKFYTTIYKGFYDYKKQYRESSVAFKMLKETIQGKDTINGDNVFNNAKGEEPLYIFDLMTHTIVDFDKSLLMIRLYSRKMEEQSLF